jgi:cysteate synthase
VRTENPGIFRFADWLPVSRTLPGKGYPVTYRSESLARKLGLERLYITFSGYWPEKGAAMSTGTFKECEAYAVCARYPQESCRILVVASAGNTARAFLKVASRKQDSAGGCRAADEPWRALAENRSVPGSRILVS